MATRSTAELDRAKAAKPAARAKRSPRTGPAEPADATGQLDLADAASTTEPLTPVDEQAPSPAAGVDLDANGSTGQAAPSEDEGVPLDAEAPDALALLGLKKGDPVRWRRKAGGRWQQGSIIGIETDGSMAVSDSQSRWRSLVVGQLEVKGEGPRGASRWEPLSDRITQPDQLGLFRE